MSENQFQQARFNMIEQQVRPWDVLDQRVLNVMSDTPREDYVPQQHRNLAFADIEIPLAHGERMMPPRVEGRMLQALNVQPDDVVLEIGTGSGFVTAMLSTLCKAVYTVEIHADMLEAARATLEVSGVRNVSYAVGDASQGWPEKGPYDAIAISGSMPELPDSFKQSLTVGGRLFAIVGEAPAMQAQLIIRTGEKDWTTEVLFETDLQALQNTDKRADFVF